MMPYQPDADGNADHRVAPDQPVHCSKRELLIPALFALSFRYLLKVLPLGTLTRIVGLSVRQSKPDGARADPFVYTMRNRMSYLGSHYPALGDCVPQCLAAGALLRLHGVRSTMRFGVIKSPFATDPLQAHAWLTVGTIVVSGGGPSAAFQELGQPAPPSSTSVRDGDL